MTRSTLGFAAASVTMAAGAIGAPSITFNNEIYNDSGAGFGNVLTLLSLQAKGSESGSVLRSGGFDVRSGDATNQSHTVTVGEMTSAQVNTNAFGLVFNIAQPQGSGSSVTLSAFSLVFYDANDNVLFTSSFAAPQPLVLDQVGSGVGTAGWLFNIAFSDQEAAQFFGTAGNRIGMIVPGGGPILNSEGGPETFYLVPGPGVMALSGLSAVVAARRTRRR